MEEKLEQAPAEHGSMKKPGAPVQLLSTARLARNELHDDAVVMVVGADEGCSAEERSNLKDPIMANSSSIILASPSSPPSSPSPSPSPSSSSSSSSSSSLLYRQACEGGIFDVPTVIASLEELLQRTTMQQHHILSLIHSMDSNASIPIRSSISCSESQLSLLQRVSDLRQKVENLSLELVAVKARNSQLQQQLNACCYNQDQGKKIEEDLPPQKEQ